jgi:cytochrome P450
MNCQTEYNQFYETIKNQMEWLVHDRSPPSLLTVLNPLRPLIMWNNNRIMRNYLLPALTRAAADKGSIRGPKTITSLAVQAYEKEVKGQESSDTIDPEFLDIAISQMKMFIFAGHETTASTLCFVYHLLWTHPDALANVRKELDDIVGPDESATAEKIAASPQLLYQLPYMSAVIKETLRLYPPIGTARMSKGEFFLTHPETGNRYPTAGYIIFGCSVAEQHDAKFFPRPDDFIPERWMAPEGDPMYVRKNTYRPFELGPRNCIGQELTQLELRAILALTVRDMDVQSAYDENGPKVLGNLAYQVMKPGDLTGHPCQQMPIKVSVRNNK